MRQLPTQRLGLAVGAVVGVVVTLAVVGVAVLGGGHDSRHAIYTLRQGDVVRDPLTATRCEATAEGGTPNLFCTRTTKGRHQFVFYKDAVLVFDLGDRTR